MPTFKPNSIGLGLVTCKAPEKIVQSAPTVPQNLDAFVIVNDGTPYPAHCYPAHAHVITHPSNLSVGQAKNTAFTYLMDQGIEHLFLMEDDVIIKNPTVFNAYVDLARTSGIGHLSYALQGPSNMQLPLLHRLVTLLTLGHAGRTFDESKAIPAPIAGVEYANGTRMAVYRHCPGAFCYYHRSIIEKIGLNDTVFINALEHLDHTYRIAQANLIPPYGYFGDLLRSDTYLGNIPDCMANSTIARLPGISTNQKNARAHFLNKHATTPRRLIRCAPQHLSQARQAITRLAAQAASSVQSPSVAPQFFIPFPETWNTTP